MTKLRITNDQIVNGTLSTNVSLEGVEELYFSHCGDLETIPNLPAGIKKINFSWCKKLKTMPEIPEGVEELYYSVCNDI